MFGSILVPLCGRADSSPVVRQAIELAGSESARLLGLYVVDQEDLALPPGVEGVTAAEWRASLEPELRAAGQGLLEEFASKCAVRAVSAEVKLAVGSVADLICTEARGSDLIVMGRGRAYLRRSDLLGVCPLEGVIRQACRPVLVAVSEPRTFHRILLAYDGGARAQSALEMAARLAREWQTELLLVTVREKNVGPRILEDGQARLLQRGLAVKAVSGDGTAAAGILGVAAGERADLIVIGAYCHGKVQELVFGGTVGQVVRKAPCPVLVCP